MANLSIDELIEIVTSKLILNGVSKENAKDIAGVTLEAQLRGITSHGVKMIPVYIERLRKGGLKGDTTPEVEKKSNSIYLINGNGTFGQVAGRKAVEIIKEGLMLNEARFVGIYNTNHCGMLAYYTQEIAKNGGIGFMTTNTNPNTAAFGGAEKILGTNPFSISFPTKDDPIVIDMATTSIAKGKFYEYKDKGLKLPEGVVISEEGETITDPEEAMKGILLPFAGYKGYAISLAVEILSGVITGAGYSKNVKSLHGAPDVQQNVGILMGAIPATSFISREEYDSRIADFKAMVKDSKKAKNTNEIFFPGDLENLKKAKNLKEGIYVDDSVLEEIKNI